MRRPSRKDAWTGGSNKTIGPKKKGRGKEMARRTKIEVCHSTTLVVAFLLSWARVEAQTFNELIDGAKKESEMSFVAGRSAESEPEQQAQSTASKTSRA
jgi:hypothetical protein